MVIHTCFHDFSGICREVRFSRKYQRHGCETFEIGYLKADRSDELSFSQETFEFLAFRG